MAAGVKWKSGGNGKLIAKLKKIGNGGKKTKLTAGFYKGAKYEDGTPVAQVAAWNNFGTIENGGFTPPRPFFNDAIDQNMDKWSEGLAKRLKETDYDVKNSMERLGLRMRSDIQKQIDKGNYEPNAKSTKRRKANAFGSHNQDPLKDTLKMMSSVAYSYNDGKEQYDEQMVVGVEKRKEWAEKMLAKRKKK